METEFAVFPFGEGFLRVACEAGAVTAIHWLTDAPGDMGTPTALTETVRTQLSEYLAGERREFDFPYALRGTPFQKSVWDALLTIPWGETRTYGQIAAQIGRPRASRAVGMACNRNPILIAVPCHRVVGADGSLTGYACGLEFKRALLDLEAKNRP